MVKEATIPKPVLVAHGGAGVIPRNTPKEKVDQYLAGMRAALTRGNAVLQNGGRALDAVMETVIEFEDNPLFTPLRPMNWMPPLWTDNASRSVRLAP